MSSHSDYSPNGGVPSPSKSGGGSTSNKGDPTISNFSPISTLARQYQNHPAAAGGEGGRLLMAVHCNPACCVTLEEVWKVRNKGAVSPSVSQQELDAMAMSVADTSAAASPSDEQQQQQDPFSFLNNGDGSGNDALASVSAQQQQQDNSTKKKPNLGRFLKKVAATGTQALERGMHQLAVKADQGKSPDRLVLGVYGPQPGGSSNHDVLLHATEAESLPATRADGVHFRIPLAVPATTTTTVVLKLWIRSGAALAASKHYLVAESGPLDTTKLRESLLLQQHQQQQAKVPFLPALFFPVPLQSSVVVDGQLRCTVVAENKFPPTCGKGWSLQDPNPATAYSVAAAGMFHLPLDQSYAFAIPHRPPGTATLLATERTVESAVVLPIATAFAQLAANACRVSLLHCEAVGRSVLEHRHDSAAAAEYADVKIRLSHLQTNVASSSQLQRTKAFPTVSMSFQRPNSIFEVEILPSFMLPMHPTAAGGFRPDISCQFYPKPVRQNILPGILQQLPGGRLKPGGFLLGNVRILIAVPSGAASSSGNSSGGDAVTPVNPFDAATPAAPSSPPSTPPSSTAAGEVWECIIPLEAALSATANNTGAHQQEYPVFNRIGQNMGSIILSLSVQIMQSPPSNDAAASPKGVPAVGGLVELVGLPNLMDGVFPALDFDENMTAASPEQQRRRSQLATMGNFVTHGYLDQHLNFVRKQDTEFFQERATQYKQALDAAMGLAPPPEHLPSHQDRTPRPFRPSASRSTMLLSGIGFNVHTASFSLDVLDSAEESRSGGGGSGQATMPPPVGTVFHNITCGAPADHARGFSDVFATKDKGSTPTTTVGLNSPIGPATGGLRRLEAARRTLAEKVSNEQTMLVMLIQNYFVSLRQQTAGGQKAPIRPITHVPAQNAELQGLRWKVFEAVQCLHHLTWTCAVRRASVFSQALGIAVSSYLSSISDPQVLHSTWPETWTRHGYLVSYEGLLSAAGKELGMIEDASVAINMLQNVRVILVPDDGVATASRVPVPHSLYLRWIHLWATPPQNPAEGKGTEYVLQIGIVPSYFDQRIPQTLKNGAAVRFFPLLFEVGVDIFQAASNAGSNMSKRNTGNASTPEPEAPKPRLTEDEEDDTGIVDDDVLVQLNYEGFQKMNVYAQAVSPAAPVQATQTHQTHPLLATLFQHIVSSSGKMNHDILDEAANLAQQLGGGGVVFCKSGKDRTAMHVTYKQAQFETRFRSKIAGESVNQDGLDLDSFVEETTTLDDAMLIRLYGTRLPICEKNVGQAKYAFNSLQVKFMPDALKPPMSALAGFLKGGKVFGKSGIES